MIERSSGILLHITSLPSRFGVGDLGPEAYRFAAFLAEAGQRWWQILPITPTSPGLNNSPYSSFSAFAANNLLVSPELMAQWGYLKDEELARHTLPLGDQVDYDRAHESKRALFHLAFDRVADTLADDPGFQDFCRDNAHWLNDFAFFIAVKEHLGGAMWMDWPEELRDRHDQALHHWGTRLSRNILYEKFMQWLFFRQWGALREVLRDQGVGMIGDAPIYVTHDSSDVWVHRDLFKLAPDGRPLFVAGVPPDYFSKTGQLWGNPVFDWDRIRERGFDWWIQRLLHYFGLFDLVRLDHFRGFAAYWEIPAGEPTAVRGRWIPAPGEELFEELSRHTDTIPMIAEDLGVITPDVVALKDRFDLPGMKILQFAWGEGMATNRDIPFNYESGCVVYTGTHDNNTTRGWFRNEAGEQDLAHLESFMGKPPREDAIAWDMIRIAWTSVADLAMTTVQDLLGLGPSARMNTPSVARGNWGFRLAPGLLDTPLARRLKAFTEQFGRGETHGILWDDYETYRNLPDPDEDASGQSQPLPGPAAPPG